MKKHIVYTFYLFALLISFSSCSSDETSADDSSNFPMTAKVNGEQFNMANAFGTNEASSSINTNYPNATYIFLQGRPKLDISNLSIEINIWINRNDLKVGTYTVNASTEDTATHIDIIDLRNDNTGVGVVYESTISGNITITSVDSTNKIVKGTFEFDAIDDSGNSSPPMQTKVTEGTFNYKYDVK